MAAGKLIPTQIVDKNGRQTTVHRKSAGAASGPKIPAAMLPTETRTAMLTRLIDDERPYSRILLETYNNGPGKLRNDELVPMLSNLSPEAKDGLHQIESTWKNGWVVIKQCAEYSVKEKNIASINNMGLFHTLPQPGEPRRLFTHYISGLQAHVTDINDPVDYTTEPESERAKARALLKVTLETDRAKTTMFRGTGHTHLISRNLIQMVLKRPEDADKLIRVLNTGYGIGSHTPDEIKRLEYILDQDIAMPLIDGIL